MRGAVDGRDSGNLISQKSCTGIAGSRMERHGAMVQASAEKKGKAVKESWYNDE